MFVVVIIRCLGLFNIILFNVICSMLSIQCYFGGLNDCLADLFYEMACLVDSSLNV